MDTPEPMIEYTEPDVKWPVLEQPVIVTRDLTLVLRKKGKAKSKSIPLVGVKLEVLVNMCLYIVCEDSEHLRCGKVLSRNLDMTKKRGGSVDDIASHCFISYDGVNEARRGIGRIDGNYKLIESPNLSEWRKELDWMMRQAWTLHRDDADETQYVWRAESVVKRHRGVVNERKVEALEKTRKAASRMDKIPRRNTGMIPLLCGAADDRLFKRMQDIRGIGRRMDWRGAVLENYIDQMRSKCLEIERAVEQRLSADTVFGPKATRANVLKSASRMRDYAQHLRGFHVRPFTRALAHVAKDLESAAVLMESNLRDNMEPAKAMLRRIYRSMRVLEIHWRIEEVLVLVSEAFNRKRRVQGDALLNCIIELKRAHADLSRKDPFTKEWLEEGFERQVTFRPKQYINLAWLALNQQMADSNNRLHTNTAYEYIKEACLPF